MTPVSGSAPSSFVDLGPSRTKRFVFIGIGVAALGVVAVIVLKLLLTVPGAAACEHLATLEDGDRVVQQLERYVESHVVELHLVSKEHLQVSSCHEAIAALDQVLGHRTFTRITDCLAQAKTAATASRCL